MTFLFNRQSIYGYFTDFICNYHYKSYKCRDQIPELLFIALNDIIKEDTVWSRDRIYYENLKIYIAPLLCDIERWTTNIGLKMLTKRAIVYRFLTKLPQPIFNWPIAYKIFRNYCESILLQLKLKLRIIYYFKYR